MKKVKVKIIKENNDLEVGTVKALPEYSAKRIVEAGFAEYYKEEKPKPAPKKRAPKKEAE
jgi:hypothetical protein